MWLQRLRLRPSLIRCTDAAGVEERVGMGVGVRAGVQSVCTGCRCLGTVSQQRPVHPPHDHTRHLPRPRLHALHNSVSLPVSSQPERDGEAEAADPIDSCLTQLSAPSALACIHSRFVLLRRASAYLFSPHSPRVSDAQRLRLASSLSDEDIRTREICKDARRRVADILRRHDAEDDAELYFAKRSAGGTRPGPDMVQTNALPPDTSARKPRFIHAVDYHLVNELVGIVDAIDGFTYDKRITRILDTIEEPLSIHAYNLLVKIHAIRGNSEGAVKVVQTMIEKAGIQPNIDTFTYVILAFGMTKDVVEAQRWFEVYRNSSEPNGDGPYTSLISAYVSCNNATSALKVITQILAEDRIPMQSVHLVAFLRALLDAREYRNILDWRTRLLPGTPTASKYPPLTPAIKDIFFEAAVALRVRYRLIKDVFPTPSAPDASERTPSGLVLSEFGTWNLVFQQNEDAGLATLRVFLLDAGHRIAVPPLRKFMEAVLQLMPAKPSSGVPVMRRDLEVLAMARHRGIKGDEFRGLVRVVLDKSMRAGNTAVVIRLVKAVSEFLNRDEARDCRNIAVRHYLEEGRIVVRRDKRIVDAIEDDTFQTEEQQQQQQALNERGRNSMPIFKTLDLEDFECLFEWVEHPENYVAILTDMEARGLRPNEYICNTVLAALKQSANPFEYIRWIESMRGYGLIETPRRPEDFTMQGVKELSKKIEDHVATGNLDAALALSEEIFLSRRHFPSLNAASTLIKALISVDRTQDAQKFTEIMIQRRPSDPIDAKTHNFSVLDALFSAWVSKGNSLEAFQCALRITGKTDRLPHAANMRRLLNNLMASFSDEAPVVSIADAVKLVQACQSLISMAPSELKFHAYAPTISDFVFILSLGDKPKEALSLYNALKRADLFVRPLAHKQLIAALAFAGRRGDAMEVLEEAMMLVTPSKHMQKRGGHDKSGSRLRKATGSLDKLDSSWFDPVIAVDLSNNRLAPAQKLLQTINLKRYRMVPNTLRLFVEAQFELGDLQEVARLFWEFRRQSFYVPIEYIARLLSSDAERLRVLDLERLGEVVAFRAKNHKDVSIKVPKRDFEKALLLLAEFPASLPLLKSMKLALYTHYGNPSTTELGNALVRCFSHYEAFDEAMEVIHSMAPFSEAAENSRNLKSFLFLAVMASETRRDDLSRQLLLLMKQDEFPIHDIDAVDTAVKNVKKR